MPARRPLGERFWEKVERRGPDECWPWLGSRDHNGYGQITLGRRGDGKARAHRVSFNLAHLDAVLGPDEFACHRCDNPPCVNPAHLFRGTNADNQRDALRKGRLYNRKPTPHACPRGHTYTPENTVFRPNPRSAGRTTRRCRECARECSRAWKRKTGYRGGRGEVA